MLGDDKWVRSVIVIVIVTAVVSVTTVVTVVAAVVTAVVTVVAAIVTAVVTVVAAIVTAVVTVVAAIVTAVAAVVAAIVPAVVTVVAAIVTVVAAIVTAIVTVFAAVVTAAVAHIMASDANDSGGAADAFVNFTATNYLGKLRDPPTWEIIVKVATYVPIAVVASVGNVLVMLIVARCKFLHSNVNFFIWNLALADLLTVLLESWVFVVHDLTEGWVLGPFYCKFHGFIG
ncbi:PREDICTED: tyramine/octopamine receptor-like, partial [Priapulus caudatus]|uniref:Tyramine/octopamine receptor-like n=1 Tax=Priapulus caudatus TaxID=37621 RepID=A0ABM1F3H0_PRICU